MTNIFVSPALVCSYIQYSDKKLHLTNLYHSYSSSHPGVIDLEMVKADSSVALLTVGHTHTVAALHGTHLAGGGALLDVVGQLVIAKVIIARPGANGTGSGATRAVSAAHCGTLPEHGTNHVPLEHQHAHLPPSLLVELPGVLQCGV